MFINGEEEEKEHKEQFFILKETGRNVLEYYDIYTFQTM